MAVSSPSLLALDKFIDLCYRSIRLKPNLSVTTSKIIDFYHLSPNATNVSQVTGGRRDWNPGSLTQESRTLLTMPQGGFMSYRERDLYGIAFETWDDIFSMWLYQLYYY